MPRHTSPPRDSDSTPTVPEPIVEPRQSREAVVMGSWKVAIALVVLSAGYYLNMLIMLDVVIYMQYQTEYTRQNLIRMWDALLVGQFIGQVVMGALCDAAGCSAALCASTIILLLGGILCVTARSISESPSRIMWFLTIARGIIGVGIGGVYPSASTMVIEGTQEGPRSGQDFVMITNTVFTAGGPLASVIFLIVLSAAQPQHLDTVWPVCIGIGIVLPVVALCCCGWQMLSSRYKHHALQYMTAYAAELRQHWLTILRVGFFWLIYDFVAVPKIVFSGLILFTILDGHLWRTAGFELLLGAFALAGSITGAMLCDSFGRHKTLCISFVGYIVFALVIGCAYDRLVKIVPLFVVLYASMLFMGNMGPGNLLALMTAKSYPGPARGSLYGVTAAFGTTGAVAGIHAFSAIDENLRKQWGFIFVAICGLIGIILAACFLPQDPASAGGEIPDLASDAVPVARPDGHRSSSSIGLDVDNKDDPNTNTDLVDKSAGQSRRRGSTTAPGSPNADNALKPLDQTRNHEVSYLDDTTVQLNGGLLHANPTHDSSNAHHNRVNGFVGPNVARQASGGTVRASAARAVAAGPTNTDSILRCFTSALSQPIYPMTDIAEVPESQATSPACSKTTPSPLFSPVVSPVTTTTLCNSPTSPLSNRILCLHRMSASEVVDVVAPEEEWVPEVEEVQDVIAQQVASSQLQKFFKEDSALTQAVASNVSRLQDDGQSFPHTRQNVDRLIRLSLYHPVIYCDDSGSMTLDVPRSRWDLLRDAVRRIASISTRVLPPQYGISLRFINAQHANKDNVLPSGILNALPMGPDGGTALGRSLKWNVLQPLVYDVLQRGGLLQRPLMICIITDGCPDYDDNPTFEGAILECRQRLVDSGYEPTAVRFCVNQIGCDEYSTRFLEQLRTNTQIQDVVYCTTQRLDEKYWEFRENGRLIDEWLLKMLSEPIMHRAVP